MRDALTDDLPLFGADALDRCKAFIVEDPRIVADRRDLQTRIDRLAAAQEAVQAFGR